MARRPPGGRPPRDPLPGRAGDRGRDDARPAGATVGIAARSGDGPRDSRPLGMAWIPRPEVKWSLPSLRGTPHPSATANPKPPHPKGNRMSHRRSGVTLLAAVLVVIGPIDLSASPAAHPGAKSPRRRRRRGDPPHRQEAGRPPAADAKKSATPGREPGCPEGRQRRDGEVSAPGAVHEPIGEGPAGAIGQYQVAFRETTTTDDPQAKEPPVSSRRSSARGRPR